MTQDSKYILMPQTSTYALGVDALRTMSKTPFTFKENVLARVEAYESGNPSLFGMWLDSCTGIVYKAGTTKFKLVPNCTELCSIPAEFNHSFMLVDYATIDGVELDSVAMGKYNTSLTKAEVLKHPAWRAAVEDDTALLKTYRNIVFRAYAEKHNKIDTLMGFYVRQNTEKDELRAVFVHDLCNYSYANGYYILYSGGRFLRR